MISSGQAQKEVTANAMFDAGVSGHAVATKPEARGLGIASMLMITAMQAAKDMGHKLCVLDSFPLAEKLDQRLGFINLAPLRLYSPVTAVL